MIHFENKEFLSLYHYIDNYILYFNFVYNYCTSSRIHLVQQANIVLYALFFFDTIRSNKINNER